MHQYFTDGLFSILSTTSLAELNVILEASIDKIEFCKATELLQEMLGGRKYSSTDFLTIITHWKIPLQNIA